MTIEVRAVDRFDQVRFKGPGTLRITQCDDESLTIHAPRYVLENIESIVDKGVLRLGYVNPKIISLRVHKEVISYDLKMKDVRRLTLSGSGRVVIPDLDNDHVSVDVSGSGQVLLDQLTADRFDARISGLGGIQVVGDVEVQSIIISGSGNYLAEKLISDFSDIKVTGSGNGTVTVNDELSVAISGSGTVSYSGYPDIYKRITGSGKIVRRRKQSEKSSEGKEHG